MSVARGIASFARSWAALPRHIRLLNAARFARAIAQGLLATDFALYLKSLGWSGASIGSLLTAALVFSACITVVGSIASDRYGRKAFLLAYDSAYALACLTAALSTSTAVLAACAVVGGFGRGANGAAGPFGAIERAWVTQGRDKLAWTRGLNMNSTLGFLGMAIGAGLAMLPSVYPDAATGAPDFRMIFPLAMAGSLVCLVCLGRAEDRHREASLAPAPGEAPEAEVRRAENRSLRQLAMVNLLRGAGTGLVGPLMSYWFAVRFHVGPEHIGPMMAVGFLLAAVASQISAHLGMKHGMMAVIVRLRLLSMLLMAALPLSPNLAVAVAVYLARATVDRSSNGPRAAITANLVRNRRRGLAGTVSAVSQQLTRSVGPVVAGLMFDADLLAMPFFVGALFQGAYLYLYHRSFRDKDPVPPASAKASAGSVSN